MSLLQPAYWLIYVPESTEDGPAEVAAIAPEDVPARSLGGDARGVLEQAQRYHMARPQQRIVYLGEVTRWLRRWGFEWRDVNVDVFEAMRDLDRAPQLLIEASAITMAVVADSFDDSEIVHPDGWTEPVSAHVEPARAAILSVLDRDWAPWVRSALPSAGDGRTVE